MVIGVVTTTIGLSGFYATDWVGDYISDTDEIDPRLTFIRAIALFVAIIGFGGSLFGGVGVLFG